ncbi:MAG: deaminase [Rhodobacteraceae bacterium PARR1]|nr:MAG: deaminase [Rhodobacteraceae bacterium PARR1]
MPSLPSAEVFIATSLDGLIARADGGIDWLIGRPVPEGEDFGYASFMQGIGALVMGRQSFDKALTFPEWPYPVPVVVMSRSPARITVPDHLRDRVQVTDAAPEAILSDLAAQGVARVYVDGGQVVRVFLRAGLIRRMVVTMIPVLLGEGRPLWGHGAGDIDLALVTARHWPNGFAQLEYRL